MRFTKRMFVIPTTVALMGAGIATGIAVGESPSTPQVDALDTAPAARVTPAARQAASSEELSGLGIDVADARSLGRLTDDGAWTILPAREGACLGSPEGVLTCATTPSINQGGLLAIRAPNALPAKLSAKHLAAVEAGKPAAFGAPSLVGATIVGVAPDGTRSVSVSDAAGNEIANATVRDNAYVVPNLTEAPARIDLVEADGSTTRVPQ